MAKVTQVIELGSGYEPTVRAATDEAARLVQQLSKEAAHRAAEMAATSPKVVLEAAATSSTTNMCQQPDTTNLLRSLLASFMPNDWVDFAANLFTLLTTLLLIVTVYYTAVLIKNYFSPPPRKPHIELAGSDVADPQYVFG